MAKVFRTNILSLSGKDISVNPADTSTFLRHDGNFTSIPSATNADTLDGQHGSYYQDAGNINAGTLSSDRLPTNINADTLDTYHASSFTQNSQTGNFTSKIYIQSRLQNLVTNGNGLLGSNYNFSSTTFDPLETHGGGGSFKENRKYSFYSDEFIPIDYSKVYKLSTWSKAGDTGAANYNASNVQYFGITCFDIDQNLIDCHMVSRVSSATDTTLAAPLTAGNTQITLTNAAGWYNSTSQHSRHFVWYPYTNNKGFTYPNYTYTRNVSYSNISNAINNGSWAQGGINGNVITLTAPWTGPTLASGTPIRNAYLGGGYQYITIYGTAVPNEWTPYTGYVGGGYTPSGAGGDAQHPDNSTYYFRYGTSFVNVLILTNYHGSNEYGTISDNIIRHSDICLTELNSQNIEPATTNKQGVITTGTQTFAGSKTFNGPIYPVGKIMGNSIDIGNDFLQLHTDNGTSSTTNYFRGSNNHMVVNANGTLYLNWPDTANQDNVVISNNMVVYPTGKGNNIVTIAGQLQSTYNGAPFGVSNTTVCNNLNADLLDGNHASAFVLTNQTGSFSNADTLDNQHGSYYQNADNINAGTLSSSRLAGTYNITATGAQMATDAVTASLADDSTQFGAQYPAYYRNAANLTGQIQWQQLNDLSASLKASWATHGGGTITWNAQGYLKWTQRILVINAGHGSHFSTDGFFEIYSPIASAVISGVGGASNTTVTSDGTLVQDWQALYYILPTGQGASSSADNFRIVGYPNDFVIPVNWIFLAGRNGDTTVLKLWDGNNLKLGQSLDTSLGSFDASQLQAGTIPEARISSYFNGSSGWLPRFIGSVAQKYSALQMTDEDLGCNYAKSVKNIYISSSKNNKLLFADKRYSVSGSQNGVSISDYYPALFNGRGDTAYGGYNLQFPFVIQVTGYQGAHSSYDNLFLMGWRDGLKSDPNNNNGMTLKSYKIEILSGSTWLTAHDYNNVNHTLPMYWNLYEGTTLNNCYQNGFRLTITNATGSSWAPTYFYLTNFGLINSEGTPPYDAVGALSIAGGNTYGTISSKVAQGIAPIDSTSTTVCANLNADYLDGDHGSSYRNASYMDAGTLPSGRLAGSYDISVTTATNATNATNAGNSDTLDNFHLSSLVGKNTYTYNTNGLLIQTSITSGNYAIFKGDIDWTSFNNTDPAFIRLNGTISNTATLYQSKAFSLGGYNPTISVFFYNNYLCFWLPPDNDYPGFEAYIGLVDSYQGNSLGINRVTSVSHSAKPSPRYNESTIVPDKIVLASKTGIFSNADTLDSYHASSFVLTSDLSSASVSHAETADSATSATSAGTATNAGNADTLDTYHASSFVLTSSLTGANVSHADTSDNALHANDADEALNSSSLNGQSASYYLNATNISAGTLSADRLPTTVVLESELSGVSVNHAETSDFATSAGGADWATDAGDSQLLNGQPAAYFLNASNISGTISQADTLDGYHASSFVLDGQLSGASVNYATTAGNADTLDGLDSSEFVQTSNAQEIAGDKTFNNGVVIIGTLEVQTATAETVATINANNELNGSSVSLTALGYLANVTSDIQNQLDGKATDSGLVHTAGNESIGGVKTFTDNIIVGYTLSDDSATNTISLSAGSLAGTWYYNSYEIATSDDLAGKADAFVGYNGTISLLDANSSQIDLTFTNGVLTDVYQ